MKKYIHIDSLQAQSKSHPSKNANTQSTHRYAPYKDSGQSPKQTLPRSHNSATPLNGNTYTERKHDNDEASTPGTRNRTNTQRTLNDRCRNGTSPSKPINYQDERQIKREMQGYICKLTEIKNDLQVKIKYLQKMLDNSSRYVSEIDSEYQRLKITIMEYTSRCLDEAFKKYKKGMPRWSKYQEVQKKGLKIVLELNQFIQNQKNVYEEIKQDRVRVNLNSNMKELISRTAHYNVMANQIHKVIEECEEKHPTIKEEKVKQFQEALGQLCTF